MTDEQLIAKARHDAFHEAASVDAKVIAMLMAAGKVSREDVDVALAKVAALPQPTTPRSTAEEIDAVFRRNLDLLIQNLTVNDKNEITWMAISCRGVEQGLYPLAGAPRASLTDERAASATAGMNLAQRIAHVGGRENAAGYIEFGSVMAVDALIQHVLRDRATAPQATVQVVSPLCPHPCRYAHSIDYTQITGPKEGEC